MDITPFNKEELDAFIALWCADLRSGIHKQGKGTLRVPFPTKGGSSCHAYCCLGRACDLFTDRPGFEWCDDFAFFAPPVDEDNLNGRRNDTGLPDAVCELLGMEADGAFTDFRGEPQPVEIKGKGFFGALSNMNDADVTFAEIADVIEANKHLLFRLYQLPD